MPKERGFRAAYRKGQFEVEVQLQLFTWEEEGLVFVYSPAMDITGYGQNQAVADESFAIMIRETITYMQNKGSIFDELERLGWLVNRKKKRVQAPDSDQMFLGQSEFEEVRQKPGVRVLDKKVALDLA